MKLTAFAAVGLVILCLGGWWLWGVIKGNGGDGATAGHTDQHPADVPRELSVLTEQMSQRLSIARQSLFAPANAYFSAWENAMSVKSTHQIEMEAYRQMRDSMSSSAGYLGAMGVDPGPSPQPPQFPTGQILSAINSIKSCGRTYRDAWNSYNLQNKDIQLQFEKEAMALFGGQLDTNKLPPLPMPDQEWLQTTGRANALLSQEEDLIQDYRMRF